MNLSFPRWNYRGWFLLGFASVTDEVCKEAGIGQMVTEGICDEVLYGHPPLVVLTTGLHRATNGHGAGAAQQFFDNSVACVITATPSQLVSAGCPPCYEGGAGTMVAPQDSSQEW